MTNSHIGQVPCLGNPIFSSFFPVTAPSLQSGVVAATRLAENLKAYQLQWHVKGAGNLIILAN